MKVNLWEEELDWCCLLAGGRELLGLDKHVSGSCRGQLIASDPLKGRSTCWIWDDCVIGCCKDRCCLVSGCRTNLFCLGSGSKSLKLTSDSKPSLKDRSLNMSSIVLADWVSVIRSIPSSSASVWPECWGKFFPEKLSGVFSDFLVSPLQQTSATFLDLSRSLSELKVQQLNII